MLALCRAGGGNGVSAPDFQLCVGCPPVNDCMALGEGCGARWDSWRARARLEHMRDLTNVIGCDYCRVPAGSDCRNPDTLEPLARQAAHLPRLKAAGLAGAEPV